ncbi:hypothetical protein GCM10022206_52200 [Streptomyces chiangmaiensis]
MVLVVAGIWCVVSGGGSAQVVLGRLLPAVAVALVPWGLRLPREWPVLYRADTPALYALVDHVLRAVGTRGVNVIVVDAAVNASVVRYRIRGRAAC